MGRDRNRVAKTASIVVLWYKFLGTVHGMRMAFDMKKYYIATIISAGFTLALTILSGLDGFLGFEKSKLTLETFVAISVAIIIYSIARGFYDYKKTADTYTAIKDEYYKAKTLSKLKLTEKMSDAGYEVLDFNNGKFIEKYVMSHKANNYLFKNSDKIKLKKIKRAYKPIDEIKNYVPFALTALLSNNKITFNGFNIRQMQEIYPDMNKLYIQPARYFDGQCTNELTYARFNDMSTLEQKFDGKQLLCDKNDEMYEMDKSPCSNYIGMSTLVVTSDNYLIIPRQGNLSNANSGRLAPSGSGSAGKAEFKKPQNFKQLLATAMEREFKEECNVGDKFVIITEIIGYARLLERGGKPDFFGVSSINATKDELGLKNVRIFQDGEFVVQGDEQASTNVRISEYGLTSQDKIILVKLPQSGYIHIADGIEALINEFSTTTEKPQISIQLHIMKEIIKGLELT